MIGNRRLLALLFIEAGNHGQGCPILHAVLPDERVFVDDVETKEVVELFER